MSITLRWVPNTETDIAEYDIQRAPDDAGAPGVWVDLTTITHNLSGANYDAAEGRFFYEDLTGSTDHWYRIRSEDVAGNVSEYTVPFQPSETVAPPPFPNTVALYEDYGDDDTLRLTDLDGVPIENAQVRVYRKADYDLQQYDSVLGTTTTDSTGGWTAPIFVEAGYTYTVYFDKPGAFDPTTVEIVVP